MTPIDSEGGGDKRLMAAVPYLTIAVASLVGIIVALLPAVSAMNYWLEFAIVFLAVKLSGDIVRLILVSQPLLIFEDILRDALLFGVLAMIAAAASLLAEQLIGGQVGPIVPAIGAFAVHTLIAGGRS